VCERRWVCGRIDGDVLRDNDEMTRGLGLVSVPWGLMLFL
jgi:hypothetical protein